MGSSPAGCCAEAEAPDGVASTEGGTPTPPRGTHSLSRDASSAVSCALAQATAPDASPSPDGPLAHVDRSACKRRRRHLRVAVAKKPPAGSSTTGARDGIPERAEPSTASPGVFQVRVGRLCTAPIAVGINTHRPQRGRTNGVDAGRGRRTLWGSIRAGAAAMALWWASRLMSHSGGRGRGRGSVRGCSASAGRQGRSRRPRRAVARAGCQRRRRRQDGLGRLTPVEVETLLPTAHAA